MFVIMPKNSADWQHALFMLSFYHVSLTVRSDGEEANTTYMVIGKLPETTNTDRGNDLRMAETCFQMNWHQGGMICPDCHKEQNNYWGGCDGKDTCGHLIFTHPIDSSAFDKALGIS